MKFLTLIFCLAFCVDAFAQPPLNKRDQKKRAEFEAMIAAEENYEQLMQAANEAFEQKDYVKARMTYAEAIQYNQDQEQILTSKVNDLDILMAKNIARAIDSVFVSLPPKNPVKLDEPGRETDIPQRQVEKPEPTPDLVEEDTVEVEVIEKEEDLSEIIALVEETPTPEPTKAPEPPKAESVPVKPAPDPAPVVEEAVEEVKVKEDFSDLPMGITEESFEFPDHNVLRVVVKDGIDTIVFKRVKHRWGGEFYFQDDVSISKRFWIEELIRFKQKFGYETENF